MDQGRLFSYNLAETLVPPNHPLRRIRALVCDVLGDLNRSFGKLYSNEGCPSIPPEQLLCRRSTHSVGTTADGAIGLQSLVLLVRGAVADPVWDPTSFTKNRERLQKGNVFTKLMNKNHP
jgi:transposase